ncbi:MAG: hypothetical protein WCP60_01855 [bacterium]
MKNNLRKIILAATTILLSSAVVVTAAPPAPAKAPAVSPQAIAMAKNQVAVQLGAIKLGLVKPGQSAKNLNPAQIAAALAAGTLAMTQGKVPVGQLQQATLAALQTPITAPLLGLDPTKISAAAIVSAAAQSNPAVATPVIAKAAVVASMTFIPDNKGVNHPIFGAQPDTTALPPNADRATIQALNAQTKSTQLQAAASAEGVVLTAALQNIRPDIQPGSSVKIAPQDPNYAKITQAIAAISSASISGLGNFNVGATPDPLYGKTAPNVQALTINLVTASESLVNLTPPTGANGQPSVNPVLTAVAQGASQAAPTVTSAITTGVAVGAYNSYSAATTAAGQTPVSPTQFAAQNSSQIATALTNAGIPTTPATVTSAVTGSTGTTGTTTAGNGSQNGSQNENQNGSQNATGTSSTGTPGSQGGGVPGLGTFGLTPGGNSPVTNNQGA